MRPPPPVDAAESGPDLAYGAYDFCELARTRSLEEVVSLIWTGAFDSDVFNTPLHVVAGGAPAADLAFLSRAQSVLPVVAARDPLASDLRPHAVAESGWRILNLLTSVAADSQDLEPTIEETLASRWRARGKNATAIIRAALILSAHTEADPTIIAVRAIASAGSHPYGAVLGGLAALEAASGVARVSGIESLVDGARRERNLPSGVTDRVRRDGRGVVAQRQCAFDPGAALLISMLPNSKEAKLIRSVSGAADRRDDNTTLEYALVAVQRVLSLPRGSALAILAIGRAIGWIAHAIQQYQETATAE